MKEHLASISENGKEKSSLLAMPRINREAKPPVSLDSLLFKSIASCLAFYNREFDPANPELEKKVRKPFEDHAPEDRIKRHVIDKFITHSHRYDEAYERWTRTRLAKGTQNPFTGYEPWSLALNMTPDQLRTEVGQYYLDAMKGKPLSFKENVFATLQGEIIDTQSLCFLNTLFKASHARLAAAARRHPLVKGYNETVRITCARNLDYHIVSRGDTYEPPQYDLTHIHMDIPGMVTDIGTVFQDTLQPPDKVSTPQGIAYYIGRIGQPWYRSYMDFIPPLDQERINNSIRATSVYY